MAILNDLMVNGESRFNNSVYVSKDIESAGSITTESIKSQTVNTDSINTQNVSASNGATIAGHTALSGSWNSSNGTLTIYI